MHITFASKYFFFGFKVLKIEVRIRFDGVNTVFMTDISAFPAIMLPEKATVQPFSVQASLTFLINLGFHYLGTSYINLKQEVLGKTNCLLSFDTTCTA
jgi:hypothetical protein